MADRRKVKKRRENQEAPVKATKQEYVIAKYIRGHLPSKKTTLFNHKVDYFIANKAINLLLDSTWAKGSKSSQEAPLFTTRESVVEYLDLMLKHNFFHRARKIPLSTKESSKSKKKTDESSDEQQQENKRKKKGELKTTTATAAAASAASTSTSSAKKSDDKKKTEEKEKKKRKFKLDMHLDQLFMDGNEVYVWIYEPTPWKAWIVGSLLVVGAILLCLFPLWPQTVRKGVYYLSIAAAGFFVVILALALVRLVVFCVVWGISMGKHHLWLLPNLTEDVGFMESFWPIYKYEYRGSSSATKEGKEADDCKSDEARGEKEEKNAKDKGGEREEEEDERGTDDEEEVTDPSEKKKRKKKKKKSKSEDDDDEETSNEKTEEDDTKRPRAESLGAAAEHTDTDRETTDEDEEYDKFEVLNADDVPDSDSSEVQTKDSGS